MERVGGNGNILCAAARVAAMWRCQFGLLRAHDLLRSDKIADDEEALAAAALDSSTAARGDPSNDWLYGPGLLAAMFTSLAQGAAAKISSRTLRLPLSNRRLSTPSV